MGQFQDRGDNYRPVIFVADEEQRQIAKKSKTNLVASGRFNQPIVTTIEAVKPFYEAEEYHQDFYKKEPTREALEMEQRLAFKQANWTKK